MKHSHFNLPYVFLLLLLLTPVTAAVSIQDITVFDDRDERYFGRGVAVHGDYLAVGAVGVSTNGGSQNRPGQVVVYRKVDGSWEYMQTIQPNPGLEFADYAGIRIDIDGDTMIIGLTQDELTDVQGGVSPGGIYVYKLTDDAWQLSTILRPPELDVFRGVGGAVALSGNRVISSLYLRRAIVWERDEAGHWNTGTVIDHPDRKYNGFGETLDISGDTLVIGARGTKSPEAEGHNSAGAALVFTYDSVADDWIHSDTIYSTRQDLANFGSRVAISGSTIVASNAYVRVAGVCETFSFREGSWQHQQSFTTANAKEVVFGDSLSIAGDLLAIGASKQGENNEGAVYLYQRLQNNWELLTPGGFTGPTPTGEDRFGSVTAISSTDLVVGIDNAQSARRRAYAVQLAEENSPGPARLEVSYQGTVIDDGDNSPSDEEGTAFPEVLVGSSISHSLSLVNRGGTSLSFANSNAISTSGPHAGDFIIVNQPTNPALAPGGFDTFLIRFSPTAVGVRNATLEIAYDGKTYTAELVGRGGLTMRHIALETTATGSWLGSLESTDKTLPATFTTPAQASARISINQVVTN